MQFPHVFMLHRGWKMAHNMGILEVFFNFCLEVLVQFSNLFVLWKQVGKKALPILVFFFSFFFQLLFQRFQCNSYMCFLFLVGHAKGLIDEFLNASDNECQENMFKLTYYEIKCTKMHDPLHTNPLTKMWHLVITSQFWLPDFLNI